MFNLKRFSIMKMKSLKSKWVMVITALQYTCDQGEKGIKNYKN